jgi:hypothetical protein
LTLSKSSGEGHIVVVVDNRYIILRRRRVRNATPANNDIRRSMPHSERVGICGGGGGTQVILPESFTDTALVALAVAVLFICVHAATLVAALTVTVTEAFGAKAPKLHARTCAPIAPLTVQFGVVVVQFTPPPAGNGSLSVTALAVD